MKKRIFSRVLALFMALAMLSTTALADVSFDDLQEAINGAETEKTATEVVEDAVPADEMPETSEPDAPEAPAADPAAPTEPTEPEDTTHVNGALVRTDDDGTNYFGYGWSSVTENENTTWYYAIEAHDADGNRYVVLLDDVGKGNGTASGVVIGQDGSKTDVTIDMNGHSITGEKDSAVITVKENAELNLNNGTITGGEIGIDVLGTLFLDNVMVSQNGTGIKANSGSKVTFNGDKNTVNGNTTKNLSGTGKVTFKLDDQEYQVDAETAELLLAGEGSIAAHGIDWILAKNDGGETYTVVYTGSGTTNSNVAKQLTADDVTNVFKDFKSDTIKQENITGFILSGEVTSIGTRAFSRFPNLEEVHFKGNITSIGERAFDRHPNLRYVNIPDSVTSIGKSAFDGCKSLAGELKLPKNLTFLGESAFRGCAVLSGNVAIPDGVTEIGKQVFEDCTNLTGVTFSDNSNCGSIGNRAFNRCGNLSTVTIPKSVTTIGEEAFGDCKELKEVQLKGDVTSIGKSAFANCSKLYSISIPDTVTSIDMWAFSGCEALAIELKMPEGLTSLGKGAFAGCTKLTGNITIPSGLKAISERTFDGCKNLQGITFPTDSQCTSIGEKAFYKCENLKTITIPASVAELGNRAFDKTDLASIFINSSEEKDGAEAAKLVASKTDVNIFVKDDNGNLTFYRGEVTVNLGHNADNSVNLDDGSVVLTNVSGTITAGDQKITLPNVAGITASIDGDGNITIDVRNTAITINGVEYPYGATFTVNPGGSVDDDIKRHDAPPVDPPVISFDFDAMTSDTGTTIDDEAIPLAGLISRAQLVSYLYAHEGSPDGEDAEGEYTLAMAWAVKNEIVDEESDPEEIVTAAILREVMTNYAAYLDTTFDVEIEGEDDMIVMNCDEILAEFFASLEEKAA